MVANLHLLFDQVFGLNKCPNKLFSLLALEMAYLVLMDNVCNFELLFFGLELMLLVHQLLSQDALLVIEVEKHAQILRQFIVLF